MPYFQTSNLQTSLTIFHGKLLFYQQRGKNLINMMVLRNPSKTKKKTLYFYKTKSMGLLSSLVRAPTALLKGNIVINYDKKDNLFLIYRNKLESRRNTQKNKEENIFTLITKKTLFFFLCRYFRI